MLLLKNEKYYYNLYNKLYCHRRDEKNLEKEKNKIPHTQNIMIYISLLTKTPTHYISDCDIWVDWLPLNPLLCHYSSTEKLGCQKKNIYFSIELNVVNTQRNGALGNHNI